MWVCRSSRATTTPLMLRDVERLEQLRMGRRAHRRVTLGVAVEVRDPAGDWVPAVLANLGPAGFKLQIRADHLPNGCFWLRVPDMAPLAARVRWRSGSAVGCQFLLPLDKEAQEQFLSLEARNKPSA